MLDWLIIGGGIHGTHLAHVLVNGEQVGADRVAILDPHERLLGRWRHCTSVTGMTYLRSPVVHHLGLEPMELLEFSRGEGKKLASFREPYDRPSLALFEAHCDDVVEKGGLAKLHVRGAAEEIRREGDGFCVETSQGRIRARRVVLAMGSGDRLRWPKWCDGVRGRCWHLFDETGAREALLGLRDVIVVGLGISAAQFAQELIEEGARVQLVARHDVRVHQFDSEPCWLGPKCQGPFQRIGSSEERREAIREARHRGSMPLDVSRPLEEARKTGQVNLVVGEIAGAQEVNGRVELQVDEGGTVDAAHLVLATGFESPRPDRGWLGESIKRLGLPTAPCGFPMVDSRLEWSPGLFVSGPLAELALGPASRNIAGARMSGRVIARAA